jgi:hypothetical protein
VLLSIFMQKKSDQFQRSVLIAFVVSVGIIALAWAFVAHRFQYLFIPAASIWIATLVLLEPRLRPTDPPLPGQRKRFSGVAIILGFLAFVPTWYLIVALDPSLR